jgi:hypothetical protein
MWMPAQRCLSNRETVIRATNKSVLSVERGGKIMAAGTKAQPMSSPHCRVQDSGPTATGADWDQRLRDQQSAGHGSGRRRYWIGIWGSNNDDNSGVLTYVRIEFPGYEVATGAR